MNIPRIIILIVILIGCKKTGEKNSLQKEKTSIHELINHIDKNKNANKHKLAKLLLTIDSLQSSMEYSKNDSLKLVILAKKSDIFYRLNNSDSSFIYDQNLLKKANQIKDYYHMGIGSQNIGYYYSKIGVYDSAYIYHNRAKNYFINIHDSLNIGKRLISMAFIQKNQNDFFGSKETATEALLFLNSNKNFEEISQCFSVLASNHRRLLNYDDAITYYNKAINNTVNKKDRISFKNNLSTIYIDKKEYNKAIEILNNIIIDSLVNKNSGKYARILDNLSIAKWLNTGIDQHKNLLKSLHIRKEINDKRGQLSSYLNLGRFYAKKDLEKGTAYFDTLIQLSKVLTSPSAEKNALKELMKLYPKKVTIRDRYVQLQDSLYEQELKVKTQFAKYKYDDGLKQEAIDQLQKEKTVQELRVTSERNYKIIFFLAFIIVSMLTAFIAYYFKKRAKYLKQRNRTAKLEATYETEAQLSRRLHDDFGGKLNQSMLLVESEADKAVILDTLDGLYNQSRDFSREINEIDTGDNYKSELLQMLQSNTPQETHLILTGSKNIDWNRVTALNKTSIFKVLRELIINMKKYSNANLVQIGFKRTTKNLQITYYDDGNGATEKELLSKNGLRNAENRLKALGGTIVFKTEKENGFNADITIPN